MTGKTALVVDDSKSARFALRKYLEKLDYSVDTAESAHAAYRQLRERQPDLIFLDHMMPGEDGFDALRQIRADPATAAIPVVICSGNEGETFVSDARSKGAADVLAKPPTPAQLQAVLERLTRKPTEPEPATPTAPEPETPAAALGAPAAQSAPATDSTPAAVEPAQLDALLARVERLEQELAAMRRHWTEDREQISREASSRIAEALLAGLGRRGPG